MTMPALNQRFSEQIMRDPLAQGKALVMGEGQDMSPVIMLVGEAPGEQETLQRRPFVGKAGRNLDMFLEVLGLERASIYISNVVKWRPTRQSVRGRLSNRPPNRQELALFAPWLQAETELVKPRLLVTLGNTPLQAYLGRDALIGSLHGQLGQTPRGQPHFALYHPAAIIYNRALQAVYDEDLQKLKQILQGI